VFKRYLSAILLWVVAYTIIIGPFAEYMSHKPYTEKLGLIPRPEVLKVFFADYQELVGASILTRVLLYFGSLAETTEINKLPLTADYPAMSRALHAALQLDPYNMDGYYFGQSILAWDVGQYRLANELLEYGMKYRTWDWQLPYFAGFNDAYFLKDYQAAARMYMRAGELSGEPLFEQLAGRYLQQVGQTRMAIDYLTVLEKETRNPAIKKIFQIRINAFQKASIIENARDRFFAAEKRQPGSIKELVTTGFLNKIPIDPYGGVFYFDEQRNVRSTSKFSFIPQAPEASQRR